MTPLSGLDALFLMLETPEMPMHVGSVHEYDVPARLKADWVGHVRSHLATRLHLCPVFTRRLASTPLRFASPAWIDAGEIDLDYHVRHVTLPAPGNRAQFEDCVAELHSRLMDRRRPLWEFYVIDGLANGHVGFYAKVHHAAIDGQAGVALARAMLDLTPQPRPVEPPPRAVEAAPGATELLKAAVAHQLAQTRQLIRLLPGLVGVGSRLAGGAIAEQLRALMPGSSARGTVAPLLGPRSRLNRTIRGRRALATAELSLEQARRIAHALDGTLNDVVLAVCSGALRRWLDAGGQLPGTPLIAAVPVSLRATGDESQNTQATMARVSLATDVADPRARFAAIRDASSAMKQAMTGVKAVLPTDFPSIGMPWLLPGLVAIYGRTRLADRIRPPANLVISNVAGPQMPLFLAGARMLTYHPMSIVVHGMALNITVESYGGTIHFGMIGCRHVLPDLHRLADAVREACAELLALAEHAPGVQRELHADAGAAAGAEPAPATGREAAPATRRRGTAAGRRAAGDPAPPRRTADRSQEGAASPARSRRTRRAPPPEKH